jgi:hypothetical protein
MQGRDFSAELFGAPLDATNAPVGKDFSAQLFGPAPTEPAAPVKKEERPEDQSFLREFADVPLKLAGGVTTGVRMIADAFGANNAASKNLRGVEDWIGELYSAQSKKDSKRMGEIMKAAEDQGVLPQIVAGFSAFKEAPIDLIVNALGTSAPAILAAIGTTLASAPLAVAAGTTLGVGALMGAGTVKGAVYDATKQILSEQTKLSESEIEKIAVKAQDYDGKNLDQILLGAGIGAVGARTGAERIIAGELSKKIMGQVAKEEAGLIAGEAAKKTAAEVAVAAAAREAAEVAAKRGALKQGTVVGGKEFFTESLQGGQEQLAKNIAQQREGFDVPTMRGVVGQGALEGFAGLGMGAVTGARESLNAKRELAEETKPDEVTKDVLTTAGMDKKPKAATPSAEDIDMMQAATDKSGKPLVDTAPESIAAKQQLDAGIATSIQNAQDLIAKVDAGGKLTRDDVKAVGKALGITFPGAAASNVAKLNIIKEHLAQQGGQNVATTGTVSDTGGTSADVAARADTNIPAGKPAEIKPSGVVLAGPAVSPAAVGKGSQPAALAPASAIQADRDELNSLFDDDESSLFARIRRSDTDIARDEKLDKIGNRFGLSRSIDETPQQFRARISEAMDFEQMREGKPMSAMPLSSITKQTLREETSYIPPDLQIEEYEKYRELYNDQLAEGEEPLPAYKQLSNEDRRIYFQDNISRPGAGTPEQHATAAQKLAEFRAGVKEEAEPYQVKDKKTGELLFNKDGTPQMARTVLPGETSAKNSYNNERITAGQKTGLAYSFPVWNALSDVSQKLFMAVNKTNAPSEHDAAFRAVKKQIQTEKTEEALREKSLEEQSRIKNRVQAIIDEKELKEEDKIPSHIIDALLAGDIKTVLDHIRDNGNGLKLKETIEYNLSSLKKNKAGRFQPSFKKGVRKIRDSVAMSVFRNLAGALGNIDGLKVNVVFDENMIYNQLARYDAKTNTVFIGPNGLDEATILHELTHAATVKIIHQFYTDASKLTPRAREAVQRLINIAAAAKKALGSQFPSKNYPYNPFENLYEFVAYSQSDMDFQHALAQVQVPRLAVATDKTTNQSEEVQSQREATRGASMYDSLADNLWNLYTGTLAYMYKLFTPGTKNTAVLLPTEKSRATTKTTSKQEKAGNIQSEIEAKKLVPNGNENADQFNERIDKRIDVLYTKLENLKQSDNNQIFGAVKRIEDEINKLEESKVKTVSERDQEAVDVKSLFDDPEKEMKAADIEPLKNEMVIQQGVANLVRGTMREAGYRGSLLLEAAEMFQLILAAPEGGITQLGGKEGIGSELYATQLTPEEQKPRTGGLYDKENIKFYKLTQKQKLSSKTGAAWRSISTAAGWRNMVRLFQDKSYHATSEFQKLRMANLINPNMDEAFNNVTDHRDLSTGESRNFVNSFLREPMDKIKESVSDYARLSKQTIDEAVEELHMLAEMFHEPERRHVKWIISVPLSLTKNIMHAGKLISAAQRRIDIMGDPRTGKEGLIHRVELSEAQRKQLWSELEALADKHADEVGDSPRIKNDEMRKRLVSKNQKAGIKGIMAIDENAPTYNVLGINKAEVDLRMEQYKAKSDAERAALESVFANARKITKATSELNKIGNYWSFPVSNLVGMYDYQHYLPFKGVKHSIADEFTSFDTKSTGKEGQEIEFAADGRFSVSDNPILQMMSDAFRSAGRAGRRNYMQAIRNAVKPNTKNPTGTGVIEGEVIEHITFAQKAIVDLTKFKGGSNIFVYNSDGSIDIVKINDPRMLNALRYSFRDASPMLDMANAVTGFFGAMHTRFNYNFAPLNFVRDALTNAWNIGASNLGPAKSLTYIKLISQAVVKNGLGKAMEVAFLHEKGDDASKKILADMVAKDPFARDLLEYLQFGGKTTYLDSFSLKSSLSELGMKLEKRPIMDNVDKFNGFVDVWNNMFEFTSRTAAYSLYKQEVLAKNIAKGMSNEKGPNGEMSPAERAAITEAAAWTKNLANFEKAGEYARSMGALYMFIRASATGAVRAGEAALPAFRSLEKALNDLPDKIKNDPAALAAYTKEYELLQKNARVMVTALFGMGFMTFWMSSLMSPDDEWKRNNVKNDNLQQWTRFARFHIPDSISGPLGMGKNVVLQLPWGFGLGAFAAVGAQFAGMSVGMGSFKDGVGNIVTSITDSFLPIPISKIPPTESPEAALKWAIDSVTPTVFRPAVEYVMNTNGIGQGINSATSRRMGDAFTGGDRIPEIYKTAAAGIFRSTDGYLDWSPNTLYFFSNSYLDGLSKLAEITYSWANLGSGKKEFNPKTDIPLLGSFFGAKANVDAREYGNMETRIKEMDKRLTTLDEVAPERAAMQDAKNPLNRAIIDAYKIRQGELNKLREEANKYRNMPGLSIKQRDAMVKLIIMQENMLKHEMVMDFKAYGMKP